MKKVKRFLTALLCTCVLTGIMATVASAVTILTIINLTVTAPSVGKKPETTTASVPDHAHSVVKKLEWSGNFDSNGAFKAGEKYTATVTMGIKAGEDWKFSKNVTMSVKVNEKAADKIWYINDKELEVVYTFPALSGGGTSTTTPTVLKEVEITLTAPQAGKTPAATATVPTGASYSVKDVVWTKGDLSTGKFVAGTEYTAEVTLGIKSGKNAVFPDKNGALAIYVNNQLYDVTFTRNSDTEIVVPVKFEKTAAATPAATAIDKIQLTLDAPAWGKTPASTATVPSTAHTEVKSVKWSGQLDTDGTFMPRVKYTATITMGIRSGANYYFSDKANSLTVTVNGKSADAYWHSNTEVEVVYTFDAVATGSTITMAYITIDGPAAGEKPATTAHIASTASTYIKSVRWEGALDSAGRFQAGKEYTAYITLAMKDNGRKFSTKSFDATVNGVLMDEVTPVSDTEIIIEVEFEKTPDTTTPIPPSAGTIPASGTAYASTQTVDIDGKKVEFQMYALRDAAGNPTNYIKVRDLALALNSTKAQFSVDWNGTVNLVAGKAYAKTGTENSTPFSGNRAYKTPTNATNVNGAASDLTAIVLTDDNGGDYTYYQLRDLGRKLGFNVGWSSEKGVYIETDKPYID